MAKESFQTFILISPLFFKAGPVPVQDKAGKPY